MEYMEAKMQEGYDSFDERVERLDPFINELLSISKKHHIDQDDLYFVWLLFKEGFVPPLPPI